MSRYIRFNLQRVRVVDCGPKLHHLFLLVIGSTFLDFEKITTPKKNQIKYFDFICVRYHHTHSKFMLSVQSCPPTRKIIPWQLLKFLHVKLWLNNGDLGKKLLIFRRLPESWVNSVHQADYIWADSSKWTRLEFGFALRESSNGLPDFRVGPSVPIRAPTDSPHWEACMLGTTLQKILEYLA